MPRGRYNSRYKIGSQVTSDYGETGSVVRLQRTYLVARTRDGRYFTISLTDEPSIVGQTLAAKLNGDSARLPVKQRLFPEREDLNSRICAALREGERAGIAGVSALNCPYAKGKAEYYAWLNGHTKGSEQYTPDRGKHVSGMGVGTWNGVTRFRTQ